MGSILIRKYVVELKKDIKNFVESYKMIFKLFRNIKKCSDFYKAFLFEK